MRGCLGLHRFSGVCKRPSVSVRVPQRTRLSRRALPGLRLITQITWHKRPRHCWVVVSLVNLAPRDVSVQVQGEMRGRGMVGVLPHHLSHCRIEGWGVHQERSRRKQQSTIPYCYLFSLHHSFCVASAFSWPLTHPHLPRNVTLSGLTHTKNMCENFKTTFH